MENMTPSKLWRQEGKKVPFKEFLAKYNSSKEENFKNATGDTNTLKVIDPTPKPRIGGDTITVTKKPDNTQQYLYIGLGIMVGVVGVMLLKKLKK
jgi:hypothetical protein